MLSAASSNQGFRPSSPAVAHDVCEPVGQGAGGSEGRQHSFHLGDQDRVGSGQVIASRGQQTSDLARGRGLARDEWHGTFRPALARGPFSDNPEAAAEALSPKAAPEFGSIPAAIGPLLFQPRKPGGETALPQTEDIVALAAHDPADQPAAQAGCPDDPFDWNSLVGHLSNHAVGRLTALKALILQLFCRCQQGWIQFGRPDGLANGCHAPLHGQEEGGADVFQEMPSICDLNCLWQGTRNGTTIATVAVSGDNLDIGMGTEPGFDRGWLAIWKQVDHLPPLKIANQCSVALATPPGPIVDAENAEVRRRSHCVSDTAQERILAHRKQETPSQRLGRSSAERQSEMSDQSLQSRRSPRIGCAMAGENRSTKIRVRHGGRHRKRRADRTSSTTRPCAGKSANRR